MYETHTTTLFTLKVHVNIFSHSFAKTVSNVMQLVFQSFYLMSDLVNINIRRNIDPASSLAIDSYVVAIYMVSPSVRHSNST